MRFRMRPTLVALAAGLIFLVAAAPPAGGPGRRGAGDRHG